MWCTVQSGLQSLWWMSTAYWKTQQHIVNTLDIPSSYRSTTYCPRSSSRPLVCRDILPRITDFCVYKPYWVTRLDWRPVHISNKSRSLTKFLTLFGICLDILQHCARKTIFFFCPNTIIPRIWQSVKIPGNYLARFISASCAQVSPRVEAKLRMDFVLQPNWQLIVCWSRKTDVDIWS